MLRFRTDCLSSLFSDWNRIRELSDLAEDDCYPAAISPCYAVYVILLMSTTLSKSLNSCSLLTARKPWPVMEFLICYR